MRVWRWAYSASSSPASSCTATRARVLSVCQALPPSFESVGRAAVGADVARDLAELVVRHEQLVVAAELELDVVAGDTRDGLDVEAQEAVPTPWSSCTTWSPGAQVGEARERAAEPQRGRRPGAAAEDLGGGQEREPERLRDEAAAGRRDDEVHARRAGQLVVGIEHARLDATQAEQRALGVAAVRERDQHPHAGGDEPAQLVLGLREAAAGERGRWPSIRIVRGGERVEPRGARDERGDVGRPRVRLGSLVRGRCAPTSSRCSIAPAATGPGSQTASAASSRELVEDRHEALRDRRAAAVVALPGAEVGARRAAARRPGTRSRGRAARASAA